ncbi:MAG: cytochrome C556 [Mesorhizobium sp.]|nr:MAG: cytochrome C556 [Mesorhizobium sp.]
MTKLIFAVSALALAATAALADPIVDRKALMKANGKAAGALVAVAKGEQPFDVAAVLAVLTTMNETAERFDIEALFPAGTDKGDTSASPKIWDDMTGFKSSMEKFKIDVAAAVATPPQDIGALKATLGAIGQKCSGCHETFRLQKKG